MPVIYRQDLILTYASSLVNQIFLMYRYFPLLIWHREMYPSHYFSKL